MIEKQTELLNQELLSQIWNDKKGRLVEVEPLSALYLSLDKPVPDLTAITKLILKEISKDPEQSLMWAKTWGMVVVGVGPGARLNCQINDVKDDRNRSLAKLETTTLISPQQLIDGVSSNNGVGEIILNQAPTTIEGFLITYAHMIDELIWMIYRNKLKQKGVGSSSLLYSQSISEVADFGFKLSTASGEQILKQRSQNSDMSVRLYGSGVNKQVQKIMGGVILIDPVIPQIPFMDQLNGPPPNESTKITHPDITDERTSEKLVAASVTFGKELHAGHMLLLGIADLLRRGLESTKPMILINNNTGPRPAGMLVSIAAQLGQNIEQVATMLSLGEFPCDRVISAYRARVEKGEQFEQAFDLLDRGQLDIFSSMAQRVSKRLQSSGLDVSVVAESDGLSQQQRLLSQINPEWNGTGFNFQADENSVRIIQKNGRLTATGKGVLSLIHIARPLALGKSKPLIAFVDSSEDTIEATKAFTSIGKYGRAIQVPGAGISFNGKLASGSAGEALPLTDIIDKTSDHFDQSKLAKAIRHMVLTRPVIVENSKSPNLATALFDFRDNLSFIADLIRCQTESEQFERLVSRTLIDLQNRISERSVLINPSFEKWLEFLDRRTADLIDPAPDQVAADMSKLKPIGVSSDFKKLETGLLKFMAKPDLGLVRETIVGSMIEGRTKASEIISSLDMSRFKLPATFIGQDVDIKLDILDAVLTQGYTGSEASARTLEFLQGPKGLAIRENRFMNVLRGLVDRSSIFTSISEDDFMMVSLSVKTCMERMGYELR